MFAPQSLDELMELFHNPEELQKRKFNVISECKASDTFHMDLPYEEIKSLVFTERDLIFSKLEDGVPKPRFEHIGSTAIEGMPGTNSPDALLLDNSFPPSRAVVKALLDSGYFFLSLAPHGDEGDDIWFLKALSPSEKQFLHLHVMEETNETGKLLIANRDRCNSDKEAFDEYKAAKIGAKEKAKEEDDNFSTYKRHKNNTEYYNKLRREMGMPETRDIHFLK